MGISPCHFIDFSSDGIMKDMLSVGNLLSSLADAQSFQYAVNNFCQTTRYLKHKVLGKHKFLFGSNCGLSPRLADNFREGSVVEMLW